MSRHVFWQGAGTVLETRKILFILALILLCSCSRENDRIKDAVMKYDALLAEVATPKRATKAYFHMAAMGEARVKMDARLKSIAFSNVKIISVDKAEAATEEVWDYIYVNYDTGKQVFDNSVTYKLKYALEKQSGKWLVADISIMQEIEKRKSQDFLQRPGDKKFSGKAHK